MADEYQRRTVITKLSLDDASRERLRRTIRDWKRGCDIAVEEIWPQTVSATRAQSKAYEAIREGTDLGSQHAILASRQAASAIESATQNGISIERKPDFTSPTVKYDSRTLTLNGDGEVSLTTLGKRAQGVLQVPDEEDGYQQQFLEAEDWELCESTLTLREGDYYLHLGFRRYYRADSEKMTGNGTVLGVDLGIENLAVTSTATFVSGGSLEHTRKQCEARRRKLQQKGTRNSYRVARRLRNYEHHHRRDVLHHAANEILSEALRYDCEVIVFEDLTDIRDRVPDLRPIHVWAFRRLIQFVRYKAAEHSVSVEQVSPEYTSIECSRIGCGSCSEENRPMRGDFCCQECGYEANADYNAAKNIALRYVRCDHQSSQRTGTCRCALKSGTISPESGFRPYPEGFDPSFTDKLRPSLATG